MARWVHIFPWLLMTTTAEIAQLHCSNPLNYVLSSLSEWNVYHLLSVFYDSGQNIYQNFEAREGFLRTNLSITVRPFVMDAFLQDFYSNPINSYFVEKNVALVLPNTKEIATELFNRLGQDERLGNGTDDMKPAVLIYWPSPCTTGDCVLEEIPENLLVSLPSMVNDIYFLQCSVNSTGTFWDVYSFYYVGRNSTFQFRKFKLDDMNNYYAIKQDFGGAELYSSIPNSVQKQELDYNNVTLKPIGGLAANVSVYMQDALNFTMSYKRTDLWVRIVADKYQGMAAQLLNEEIDVAVIKTTYLPSRNEKFTILVPHFSEGIQAFFRQPPASSIRNIFSQPFNKDLWGALIAVWFLVGFSTVLATKIRSFYDQREEADEDISGDTLLWAIAFTCQQGWHQDPKSVSMKTIFLCGSILGLIVYVAYSAALVSALSAEVVPIKDFEDLLTNGFTFTAEYQSQTIDAILEGKKTEALSDEINSRDVTILKERMKKIRSNTEGVNLVYSSQNAFMSFAGIFNSEAKETLNKTDGEICKKISSVRVSKVPFRSGMLVKKMSPYKEFFNVRLIQMYEYGLMLRFQMLYKLGFLGACDKQRNKKTDIGLELADMFTAYCIIASGYLLSLTIFLIEWMYFRKTKGHHLHKINPPDLVDSVKTVDHGYF